MVAIELYDWLKAFHVLAAVTWVGGGLLTQVLAIRIVREDDPRKVADFAGHLEWVGQRIFASAALLLVILGVWMVIESPAWDFGQFRILAALGMFGYSFVSGAFYLGPKSAQLKKMFETGGALRRDDPADRAHVPRLADRAGPARADRVRHGAEARVVT